MVSCAPLGPILVQLLLIVRQAVSLGLELVGALIKRRKRTLCRRFEGVICLELRLELHPILGCFTEFLLPKTKREIHKSG